MAMTHGRLTYLKVNSIDLSAWCDNSSPTFDSDSHETTTYGKSYKTRAGGLKDFGFTAGGLADFAASAIDVTLQPIVGTVVTFEWGPEGSAAGKTKYSGSVLVKSYNPSAPVGDMIRWTATFEGSDTVTRGTFP